MLRLVQSTGFAVAIGFLLYVGVTAALWPAYEAPPPAPDRAKATAVVRKAPSWDYSNPEIDQLIRDLRDGREAVAERSRQLDELAARLQAERNELNVVTQTVHQLQVDLDRTVLRIREEEITNLKRLAKIYATMSPEGAAGILTQLDEAAIVKIMVFMKDSETAPILETISRLGDDKAKLAAGISERLRLAIVDAKAKAKPKT